jgi:hypothetical protein
MTLPHAYRSDTRDFLGKVVDHDDSINNRSADAELAQLQKKTEELFIQVLRKLFTFERLLSYPPLWKMLFQLVQGWSTPMQRYSFAEVHASSALSPLYFSGCEVWFAEQNHTQ